MSSFCSINALDNPVFVDGCDWGGGSFLTLSSSLSDQRVVLVVAFFFFFLPYCACEVHLEKGLSYSIEAYILFFYFFTH